MKFFLTLLLLSVSYLSHAQGSLSDVMPVKSGAVEYSDVVPVPSESKNQLFDKAKQWIVTYYPSATEALQLADKDGGMLIAKGSLYTPWLFNMTYRSDGYLNHAIILEIKDGRYRYTVNDLTVSASHPSARSMGRYVWTIAEFMERPMLKRNSIKYAVKADENIKAMLQNLEQAMKAKKSDF
ncbi:DUF4468 domain-containing protein [Spirosoma sp. KUDC1026]|uniref:DUF4468 domain-containing protein n=1 Tax=Spirosoma sp. KUDC1026 TaxID=2745947 RepID=UPI00159BD976|nr:DUF4468 domain-containing protein [Spirosoma sp. KUDC1026]QKZ15204.1 DUF4468 domain-containing protein [Spirosoma sp. KUDC1026]